MSETEKPECAIAGATYLLNPTFEKHSPCLMCECGWREVGETWEDVGRYYDDHLEEGTDP